VWNVGGEGERDPKLSDRFSRAGVEFGIICCSWGCELSETSGVLSERWCIGESWGASEEALAPSLSNAARRSGSRRPENALGDDGAPEGTVIGLSSVSKEETEGSEKLGGLAEFLSAMRAEDLEPVFLVLDPAMAREG
jgi:hypothetical protein